VTFMQSYSAVRKVAAALPAYKSKARFELI
jgi:hypothetical protein